MRFHLDRTLAVPLATQLAGQIEYAVACGDLRPGQRLPTVRDLAAELGVSPVTVSGVYRGLQTKGLVVSRVGDGTYVADAVAARREAAAREETLDRAVDQLLRAAHAHHVALPELIQRLQLRATRGERRPLRLLFAATFAAATRSYADHAAVALGPRDRVDAATLEDLRAGRLPAPLAAYDAVLTIGYRVAEVEAMVAGAVPVAAVPFVPAESTRTALARLAPGARLLLVATFPQFLGALKASVARYAPDAVVVAAGTAEDADLDHALARYDAVVYATGSEPVAARLPRGLPAIEFRHVPDARAVADVVQAAVAAGGRG